MSLHLPYGRNANKSDLSSLFLDACGTCSTKHALIKALAMEQGFDALKLMIGIYPMNAANTPDASKVLQAYTLSYLPEAHCYLRHENQVFDYTKSEPLAIDFDHDLMEELEVLPSQVGEFKVNFHKAFIKKWLLDNACAYSFEALWTIREKCISSLTDNF